MFFTNVSVSAKMLHPVYRGQKLLAVVRQDALENLSGIASKIDTAAPTKEEFFSFLDFQPPFHEKTTATGVQYWKVYMPDQAMSKFALLLSCLPASQATVERVFSVAKFQSTDRETLSAERLAMETFIMVNAKAIEYHA